MNKVNKPTQKIEPLAGAHIDDVIREAIELSRNSGTYVTFRVNGVGVIVDSNSSHGLIYTAWNLALCGFIDNTLVGPHPVDMLTTVGLAEMLTFKLKAQAKRLRET